MTSAIEGGPTPVQARGLITRLGIGQIVSWGSLYYSFPVLAEPMAGELGLGKAEVYGAATLGLLVASVAAYPVGVAIDRGRGRQVMTLGSILAGLLLLAWSQVGGLWGLYAVLAGIGLVQAMTLYEPAFAVVARRFGRDARRGITALTLWGGFASTVFIPLTQLLLDHFGWRGALAALGLLNLGLCVALHLAVIERNPAPLAEAVGKAPAGALRQAMGQPAFWSLALSFTFYAATFSAMAFHMYPLLLERGYTAGTVVASMAMIGPAQVIGRIAVRVLAHDRPIRWVGLVTALTLPASLAMLMLLPPGFLSLALFAVVYGAGNGIMTIVRGLAVPEMLTREAYGAINGALALPSTIAKASAPVIAALIWGASGSYDTVLTAALAGAGLTAAAFAAAALQGPRHGKGRESGPP